MSTTVLIDDDSSPIRRSLRALFERREGWGVRRGRKWAIAVEQVKTLNPDIVILDLSMPVMNGLQAAQKISTIAPKTAMVLFTMHATEHLAGDAQRGGIKEVVSKLDGPATLMASVESFVQKPDRQRE